jgi:alpha-glucosidase
MEESATARLRLRVGAKAWVVVLAGMVAGAPVRAQTLAHKGWAGNGMSVAPWWKSAEFYLLDPLSFQDSNGDGFGDLNGIASRLDYLRGLGVDAIVLSPFELRVPSAGPPGSAVAAPMWEAVYGTEDDFERLEQEASRRNIRLVVDLSLNATESPEAMLGKARFWLSRGVGGLRLVAPAHASAEATLSDGDREERVRMLRRLCAGYVGERVLVGDLQGTMPMEVARTVSAKGRAAGAGIAAPQLDVDERLAELTAWNATVLRGFLGVSNGQLPGSVSASDTPDRLRSWDRLSGSLSGTDADAIAKMVATVLLTGREEPMLYYGQEIGMATEAAVAPSGNGAGAPGKNAFAPTPMQWGESHDGQPSFTTGVPWIEMGPNAATANVAFEDADKESLLNWYRTLSGLRHTHEALQGGSVTVVDTGYPDVVAWVRRGAGGKDLASKQQTVLVVCNLSARPVVISLEEPLRQVGVQANSGVNPLATSFEPTRVSYTATGIALPAYGVYLGEVLHPGLEDAPAPVIRHRRGL